MSTEPTGHTFVMTGATGGIGKEAMRRIVASEQECNLVLLARTPSRLSQLVDEVGDHAHVHLIAVELDSMSATTRRSASGLRARRPGDHSTHHRADAQRRRPACRCEARQRRRPRGHVRGECRGQPHPGRGTRARLLPLLTRTPIASSVESAGQDLAELATGRRTVQTGAYVNRDRMESSSPESYNPQRERELVTWLDDLVRSVN